MIAVTKDKTGITNSIIKYILLLIILSIFFKVSKFKIKKPKIGIYKKMFSRRNVLIFFIIYLSSPCHIYSFYSTKHFIFSQCLCFYSCFYSFFIFSLYVAFYYCLCFTINIQYKIYNELLKVCFYEIDFAIG